MENVTAILNRINSGDKLALDELLTVVYQQLRQIAAVKLNAERRDHTMQTADLVNEAYLRLLGQGSDQDWRDRGHFFGAAAEAMRRILVDHARQKRSLKRGGELNRVQLDDSFVADQDKFEEILAVNEALEKLQSHDLQAVELVKLRYFVGMKHIEAAKAMGITKRVADKLWIIAKTWLYRWIESENQDRKPE